MSVSMGVSSILRKAAVAAMLAVVPGAAPSDGHAKPSRPLTQKAQRALALGATDEATLLGALTEASLHPAAWREQVPAIERLVTRGAPPAVTRAAIAALGAIGRPSSSAALRPYLRHRDAELHEAAARALARTGGADAIDALREGLRSPFSAARGLSAVGLGELGAASAVPELFLALDKGVAEAATAIGALCSPAECSQLIDKLGPRTLPVIMGGLDAVFFRARPLSDDALVAVIAQLRAIGALDVDRYLASVGERWRGSVRVRLALSAVAAASPAAPGGS
jgi:HEAT repeat protein